MRLNVEIKRRTRVVGIFPNDAAITRLVGAVLMEQDEHWHLQGLYQCFAGVLRMAHCRGTDRAAAIHHQGVQRPGRLSVCRLTPSTPGTKKGIRAMPISQVLAGLVPKPLGRCRGGAMAVIAVSPCCLNGQPLPLGPDRG